MIMLSSCTLTQQQAPLTAEDAEAQRLALSELEKALIAEEKRILEEAKAAEAARAKAEAEERAREEAEEKAREAAEAKAEAEERAREEAEEKEREAAEAKAEAEERAREEAEEKEREAAEAKAEAEERAREEAEEKARKAAETEEQDRKKANQSAEKPASATDESHQQRKPRLLTTRGHAKEKDAPIVPTAEQQEAARKLLSKTSKAKSVPKAGREPQKAPQHEPAPQPAIETNEEVQLPGSVTSGALRMRRFAPPEEAISKDDEDAPLPNSVEMRGLRSPVMKGQLPIVRHRFLL